MTTALRAQSFAGISHTNPKSWEICSHGTLICTQLQLIPAVYTGSSFKKLSCTA